MSVLNVSDNQPLANQWAGIFPDSRVPAGPAVFPVGPDLSSLRKNRMSRVLFRWWRCETTRVGEDTRVNLSSSEDVEDVSALSTCCVGTSCPIRSCGQIDNLRLVYYHLQQSIISAPTFTLPTSRLHPPAGSAVCGVKKLLSENLLTAKWPVSNQSSDKITGGTSFTTPPPNYTQNAHFKPPWTPLTCPQHTRLINESMIQSNHPAPILLLY